MVYTEFAVQSRPEHTSAMSIKTKVFLIVVTLFVLLGGINFLIQRFVIFPSFQELEEQQVTENLQRITLAFDRERQNLERMSRDWAIWDDAYHFMAVQPDDFIASNLTPEALQGAGLNLLIFCDPGGVIVWKRITDPKTGRVIPLDILQQDTFPSDSPLLDVRAEEDGVRAASGAIRTDAGPLFFATTEILRTDGSGPAQGFLIMGRFVSDDLVQTLQHQTQLAFRIGPPGPDTTLRCDILPRENARPDSLSVLLFHDPSPGEACTAYADISGEPLFRISYTIPRTITRKGLENFRYASGLIAASGALLIMLLYHLLERAILTPLRVLTDHAAEVAHKKDFSRRLKQHRNDEIGSLSRSFDQLMISLGEHEEKLRNANNQLTRLSMLDALTGIANRRKFDETLAHEWRRAMRYQRPISLILLDVDHFKLYNDEFGHPRGDQCLKRIADTLGHCLRRSSDLLARYGGEEFAVIMPDTGPESARQTAEMLRQAVYDLHLPHAPAAPAPGVTISLGSGTVIPGMDPDSGGVARLLALADQALYQSKAMGRNRATGRVANMEIQLPDRLSGQGEI